MLISQEDGLDRDWDADNEMPWEGRDAEFEEGTELARAQFNIPVHQRSTTLDLTSIGRQADAPFEEAEVEQTHPRRQAALIAHFMYRRKCRGRVAGVAPIQWPRAQKPRSDLLDL